MLKRSLRRKPTKIMSNSLATYTARLDGAPTAATIDTPPINAFCSNSKLACPESKSRELRWEGGIDACLFFSSVSLAACDPLRLIARVSSRPQVGQKGMAHANAILAPKISGIRGRSCHRSALSDASMAGQPSVGLRVSRKRTRAFTSVGLRFFP